MLCEDRKSEAPSPLDVIEVVADSEGTVANNLQATDRVTVFEQLGLFRSLSLLVSAQEIAARRAFYQNNFGIYGRVLEVVDAS